MQRPGLGRAQQLLLVGLVVGLLARAVVSTFGYNYDTESYVVVAGIMARGGNVYAETARYNYGPPWSYVVQGLASLADSFADPFSAFRWLLTALLSLTDVGIAALLLRRFGTRASLFFFLNPISIFISGYHRQFDNLAILIGLLAVLGFERARRGWGSVLTGLSLSVKHLLFVFPLWLAVRERTWARRALVALLPPALFLLSFVPYADTGVPGIITNVFFYPGAGNAPLWSVVLPPDLLRSIPTIVPFVVVLIVSGVVLRRRDPTSSLLLYLLVLVTFSPSVSNQALAIVVAPIAVFPNLFFALFTAVGTLHLFADQDGLALAFLRPLVPAPLVMFQVLSVLLLAGIVWLFAGGWLRDRARLGLRRWREVDGTPGRQRGA